MSKNQSFFPGVLFITIIVLLSSPAFGQRLTGKLEGTVTDEERMPLPGVTVELSSPAMMGGIHSQITAENGKYRFIKLPPGMYKLQFSLDGFQKVIRENIRVIVGGTTTENIHLSQSAIQESIVVSAPAPAVDVTKSGLSINIDKEEIEKLPMGRYFYEVVKQTPGFFANEGNQGSRRISALGSNFESNAIQIDGIDVNYPDIGIPLLTLSQESVVEVEVAGAGVNAEYGNFTGAVINTVTKSGGNNFSGSVAYYGRYKGLTGDNNPDPENTFSYNREKFMDFSFALGGPIVKDRLWFFANYDTLNDVFTTWNDNPAYPRDEKSKTFLFKLPFQITKNQKLAGTFMYVNRNNEYSVTPTDLPETVRDEKISTLFWNAIYTWILSNNAYIELKYGGFWFEDVCMPKIGSVHDAAHYDLATGVKSGAPIWPWESWNRSHQANAHFSYFAEDFIGGEHEFKFGVQYNYGDIKGDGGYSGGKLYLDWQGEPYILYELEPYYYGAGVTSIGGFFDDSWKIGSRVTVNMGFRYDHSDGYYLELPQMDGWNKTSQTATPKSDNLITWNTFSPRIGVAIQLTSDQKTLLKASAGRYFDKLFSGSFDLPGPAVSNWYFSLWNGVSWDLAYMIPGSLETGEIGYVLDPNLKAPYADQFQMSITRELFPDFSVEASFIYKKERNLIGYDNRGGIYERINMVSPDNGKTYSVYNQTNVGTNEIWLTNPEGFQQSYRGLVLSFYKRYSNGWHMNASLVYSKAAAFNQAGHSIYGNAAGTTVLFYQKGYGKDPNDWINADGDAVQDRRFAFKVSASYRFPLDIVGGVYFSYMTGRPLPEFVRIYPDQGMRKILAEPRGEKRFDSLTMLDLKFQKSFAIHKSLRFSAVLDVFNVFNTNTVTGFFSHDIWSSMYLVPADIPYPRAVQLSLKMEF